MIYGLWMHHLGVIIGSSNRSIGQRCTTKLTWVEVVKKDLVAITTQATKVLIEVEVEVEV